MTQAPNHRKCTRYIRRSKEQPRQAYDVEYEDLPHELPYTVRLNPMHALSKYKPLSGEHVREALPILQKSNSLHATDHQGAS